MAQMSLVLLGVLSTLLSKSVYHGSNVPFLGVLSTHVVKICISWLKCPLSCLVFYQPLLSQVYFLFGYESVTYNVINSVVAYNPVSNTWAAKTASPNTGRGDVSCTLHADNKNIVVAGGWGGDDFAFQTKVYNISRNVEDKIYPS